MSSRLGFPSPGVYTNLMQWAQAVYEFQTTSADATSEVDPQPVLLAHRTIDGVDGSLLERATVSGIFMYDPMYETPVVSVHNEWEPTRSVPLCVLCYDTDANVDGDSIAVGANAVPFNGLELDNASWGGYDPATKALTLKKGTYVIEGFITISKTAATEQTFVGYLAETNDLTTAVGTVKMGSLYIPSTAPDEQTFVMPFRGQVTVATDHTAYTMVVKASATGSKFGTAHNQTGFKNVYARLSVSLVGLHE